MSSGDATGSTPSAEFALGDACCSARCRAFLGDDWVLLLLRSLQESSGTRPRHPAASRAAARSRHRYRCAVAARGRHRCNLLSFFRASERRKKDKVKVQGHICCFGVYLLKSDK